MYLNVPDCKTGIDDIQLVALEAKVPFHSCNIGIEQIASIQLIQSVSVGCVINSLRADLRS